MNGGLILSSQSRCFIGIVGVALELIPTSDVCSVVTFVKCTAGQLGMVRLWARTLPSGLKMIGGERGLLEVFTMVLFWVLGPKLCSEESGPRLRVQVRGRLYDMLWGLGPRNMGSRAQALYRGPNSRTTSILQFLEEA